MARRLRRTLPVSLGALALLGTLTVSHATAQEQPASLPRASAADSRADVQALSAEQREALQSEMDATLAVTAGGVQISANEISWQDENGQVVLVLPLPGQEIAPPSSPAAVPEPDDTSAEAVDWENCPAGKNDNRWYCFYQNSNFGGRRLQWNHAHCSAPMILDNYDFSRKISSWVNTTRDIDFWGMKVTVYDLLGNKLWVEEPWTKVSSLSSARNDKAEFFKACRL